jgi:hypothetical protein
MFALPLNNTLKYRDWIAFPVSPCAQLLTRDNRVPKFRSLLDQAIYWAWSRREPNAFIA